MGAGASSLGPQDNEDDTTFQKRQGDIAYQAGQFEDAIAWYTTCIVMAIAANPTAATALDDASVSPAIRSHALAKLYSNRSAAYIGVGNFEKALDDGLAAIEHHPTWTKGYFRASNAAMHLGDAGKVDARDHILKALALAPGDATLEATRKLLFTNFEPHQQGVGTVYSWGRGDEGQLGHGMGKIRQSLPTMLDALRGKHVVEVAAGAMHTLALLVDGDVFTWGNNSYGQCGVPEPTVEMPRLVPCLVGRRITAIACGAGHSVAIAATGAVFSWGIGKQGQLGHGYECVQEPNPRQILSLEPVAAVACGIAHTMFLLPDGSIRGCGLNSYGQLGLGHTKPIVGVPTSIELTCRVHHVACGGAHSCLVDADGRLWSAGSNSCGQLGLGHSTDTCEFEVVAMATPCALVVCGEEFSGAVAATRAVYMWGLGIAGQMGDRTYTSYDAPHLVDGLPPVETLSLSQAQVFAVTGEGGVWTWGLPGDRAHDAGAIIESPEQVAAFFGKKRVRQLGCGRKHYVMVTRGAFGPTSTLSFKNTTAKVGEWLRFTIAAMDTEGEECTTGGSQFVARLSLQDATDPKAALGLTTQDSVVEITDDMDGRYSGRCRSAVAGRYVLVVTLNSLPVAQSPFEVELVSGHVHPPHCHVIWAKTSSLLVGTPGERLQGHVECRDNFNNLVRPTTPMKSDDADDFNVMTVVQLLDPTSNAVLFKQSFPSIDSNSTVDVYVDCPVAAGTYAIDVRIDGEALHPTTSLVVQPPTDIAAVAATCRVLLPSHGVVDEAIAVHVTWDGGMASRLDFTCTATPNSHTLSARALVRCGHRLDPRVFSLVQVDASTAIATVRFEVASVYTVVVSLLTDGDNDATTSSHAIATTNIAVAPGRAHVDFTEICHGRAQLARVQTSANVVDLTIQLRDRFGNACESVHPDDVVTGLVTDLPTVDDRQIGLDSVVGKDGTVTMSVPPLVPGQRTYLHMWLNDRPIMYSPFELSEAVEAVDEENRPPLGIVVPPLVVNLDDLRRQETTRRRADQALKRERERRQAERDKQDKLKARKRTGGGFTVQFHMDE
ncbi:Aste57867_11400 [Aphanomyces stellatus]|uniref:Aste57867_11400 protein n=1 Tax=Aphanomyces stellatus TaxID=120398 RepID=A0A485KTE0_9STRA|nr:hypothetical protein As57867_011358 [Aphanomyces stellatus]VFT88261.1 Aste57867_11400 [Aphanomyces stellatus]